MKEILVFDQSLNTPWNYFPPSIKVFEGGGVGGRLFVRDAPFSEDTKQIPFQSQVNKGLFLRNGLPEQEANVRSETLRKPLPDLDPIS